MRQIYFFLRTLLTLKQLLGAWIFGFVLGLCMLFLFAWGVGFAEAAPITGYDRSPGGNVSAAEFELTADIDRSVGTTYAQWQISDNSAQLCPFAPFAVPSDGVYIEPITAADYEGDVSWVALYEGSDDTVNGSGCLSNVTDGTGLEGSYLGPTIFVLDGSTPPPTPSGTTTEMVIHNPTMDMFLGIVLFFFVFVFVVWFFRRPYDTY